MTIVYINKCAHTQETIDKNGLHKAVFTDGSFKAMAYGGIGLYAPGYVYEKCQAHGRDITARSSAITFELSAVLQAVESASSWSLPEAYIYTDCYDALTMLEIQRENPRCLEKHLVHYEIIRRIIEAAERSRTYFYFCKIKAHSGIYGNDIADMLAKIGAKLPTNETRIFGDVPSVNIMPMLQLVNNMPVLVR